VPVTLGGRGPFPFVLDSGAQGTVLAKALADSLRLPVVGEVSLGSPLGGEPLPARLVRVERLALGDGLEASLTCVSAEMPMAGPERLWGILSPAAFPGLLVTWDFAANRIVFRRGALPEPDDRSVFSYGSDPLPTVPVEIAGRHLRVHLDTGAAGGLILPAALRDSLPLAAPPVEGRTARTVDREVGMLEAKLSGTVSFAGREFRDPPLELNPAASVGTVGGRWLRDFEITLDPRQRLVRLLPPGVQPGADRAAAAPTLAAGPDDIAAIAPDLVQGMIPLPGLATGGMPRAEDFGAFARAGYRSVVDLCLPDEPRDFDERQAVAAAGLAYVNIPVTPATLGPAQFDELRRVLRDPAFRPAFVHCVAANRVGGVLLPWLVLDEGRTEEEAVALARRIGLRSAEMERAGLEYVRARRDSAR
jgi:protein tyrosine phosphatase (PTP) superfamily phosphohydrolase (DUF442 family)